MGIKKCKQAVVFLLILLTVDTVNAATVTDVYHLYDIPYVVQYPEDVTDTIQKYYNAERYLYQYRYVANSEYDKTPIESLLRSYEKEKSNLEYQLFNGYDLSLNDLYLLESKYTEVCSKIEVTELKLVEPELNISNNKVSNVPTAEEFDVAKARKSLIDSRQEVGDIDSLSVPVSGGSLVQDESANTVTYAVAPNSVVYTLLNGFVDSINEDTIVIVSGEKDIYITYSDLNVVNVDVGDKLPQGSVIGLSSKSLTISIKLDGKYVDIRKLFEQEGD